MSIQDNLPELQKLHIFLPELVLVAELYRMQVNFY